MAGALLLRGRVSRRAKLAQPEGSGIGAGWRGLRLARLAVRGGRGELTCLVSCCLTAVLNDPVAGGSR